MANTTEREEAMSDTNTSVFEGHWLGFYNGDVVAHFNARYTAERWLSTVTPNFPNKMLKGISPESAGRCQANV